MNPVASFLARLPESRPVFLGLTAFLLLIFAASNLPWHLDNYDQAKQAYVAFDIAKNGEFWFQHTPAGLSASKPPLMGWISAGLRAIGLPWDLAWRLPSFLAALAVLFVLVREGRLALGAAGATLAAAAFGLNLLTPRLATLVRTDMMLGAFIFFLGWMIYRKIRAGTAWTWREKAGFFGLMTAALLTKGPVIYAFLLPGMVAFPFLVRDRAKRGLVWSGWWTWALPLALFLAWGLAFLWSHPEFYRDVVEREFFSRFKTAGRSDERPQPLWFYFPHLLHKFAPWSALLLALPLAFPAVRRDLRARPATLWLVLWSLGGLLLMTFIPAKRVDRIYPVIPPLCLLLVEFCATAWSDVRARVAAGAAILGALAFAGGYFIGLVPLSVHERTPAVVEFAETARRMAADRGVPAITLPRSRDEGLILYLDVPRFTEKGDARRIWESGRPAALVLSEKAAPDFFKSATIPRAALDSGELRGKNERRYLLFLRD